MKFRMILRRILIAAAAIIVCFILQTALFNHLALAGIVPNLLIALTSMAGFMMGTGEGMLTGLFSGLVLDLFSGQLFGFYALIYMAVGYLNGLFRKAFYSDDVKLPLLFSGISDLIYGVYIYLTMFLIRGRSDIAYYLMDVMLPEAVYTTAVSILLYIPVNLVTAKLAKAEKKEARKLG